MTEIEAAEKIVEEKWCKGVGCDECPANLSGELRCKCGGPFGFPKTESQLQWFKDFLKGAKGMNGIDKAEAKKRLDAIEKEARELREIIEKGNRIEYDDQNVYVGINKGSSIHNGAPYILIGYLNDYFRWHAFTGYKTTEGWDSPKATGQDAIDQAIEDGFDIHVFADTRKAFEFFLENYKG